jgi:hypothetical protein
MTQQISITKTTGALVYMWTVKASTNQDEMGAVCSTDRYNNNIPSVDREV